MPILDLTQLAGSPASGRRLLGLDIGSRTIGVAVSDPGWTIASPITVIQRAKFAADATSLIDLARSRQAGGIIVGLPINMDGSEGPRCQSTQQFAANLLERIDLPLAFWDERLSTAAIERLLIAEADMPRRRRKRVVDKMAAAYILQGALDFLGRRTA